MVQYHTTDYGDSGFKDEACLLSRRKLRGLMIKLSRDKNHRIILRDRKFRNNRKKIIAIQRSAVFDYVPLRIVDINRFPIFEESRIRFRGVAALDLWSFE